MNSDLIEKTQKLAEEQILRLFVNNIPQFLFWKDKDCVYLGCNENFATSAGFSTPEEVIGKTDYDFPWSKEEADFFRKIDKEVMNSGKVQLNFEESQTLKDGSKKWLSTSKIPIFDNNKVVGILGWYIDISHYKLMQGQLDEKNKVLLEYNQQLKKSKKALEVVNSDLEKFSYAISHDLKAPLRTIISFTQILEKRLADKPKEDIKEMLDFIINAGTRMNSLIEDTLFYGRIGSSNLSPSAVNISELIRPKLKDLKQLISSKSATINLDLPESAITCYPQLLGMIFYNLISNGIKFNESAIPTINCTYTELEDHWLFKVSDNGIGIKPEFSKRVFAPFKRLVGANYEGTGLGLSICKRIANIHKGKIWVEETSYNSKGTTFNFTVSKHI